VALGFDTRWLLGILRVIGERLQDSFYVITAYKSSKIKKYWKGEMNEADI
jgi:hypothetical protein